MQINDPRTQPDFTKTTFSGYKKSDVMKAFEKCLVSGSTERACFWTAELMCSGKAADVWERLISVYSQHAFKTAPKGAVLIAELTRKFRKVVNGGEVHSELDLRNNIDARVCLAMASATVCSLKKSLPVKRTKVAPTDFDLTTIPHRLQAPSTRYAKCFQDADPKELFIATNELCYALSEAKDTALACYWVEWIVGYTAKCKKQKTPLKCATRASVSHGSREEDVAWLVWDSILSVDVSPLVKRVIQSMLDLFRLRYQPGTLTKRIFVVYAAVSACCSSVPDDTSLAQIGSVLQLAEDSLDRMYTVVAAGAVNDNPGPAPTPTAPRNEPTSTSTRPPPRQRADMNTVNMLLSITPFGLPK